MEKKYENAQNQKVLNEILNESEIVNSMSNCLNVAIIGKTGSGKSSFLNAFRGLSNNENHSAKVDAGLKETLSIIQEAKFHHKFQKDNKEFIINFFETIGVFDSKKLNIEYYLEKIKKFYNFREFDAMIFITKEKFSVRELKLAKLNQEKNVMLFFVFNQVDNFYRCQLRFEGLIDNDIPLEKQFKNHNELLEKKMNYIQKNMSSLIKEHCVFDSLISEMEKFSSERLKGEDYKNKLIEKSVYFITSSSKYFEDKLYSRDGSRLKQEIENHFLRTKFNNLNLNLLEPFSNRTIFLKKRSILGNLFNSKKFQIASTALKSIVPFIEFLPPSKIIESYKQEFLEKFGIRLLKDIIITNPKLISNNPEKIRKINQIFEQIGHDEINKIVDTFLFNFDTKDINSLFERIKLYAYTMLPSIGMTAVSLPDDFFAKIAGFSLTFMTKSITALSLVAIPLAIFLFLLKRCVEKILTKYEEYTLLFFELIHN